MGKKVTNAENGSPVKVKKVREKKEKVEKVKKAVKPKEGTTIQKPRVSKNERRKLIRKAKTGWTMFCTTQRTNYQGTPLGTLSKTLSSLWSSMTDEEKQPYEELAAKDRVRYKRELESLPKEQKRHLDLIKRELRKKRRLSGQPKRIQSAYMLYMQHNRARVINDNPGIKFTDIAREVGKEWRSLSDEDKEPYFKEYQQLKEQRYQQQVSA